MTRILVAALLIGFAAGSVADEVAVRRVINAKLQAGSRIEAVQKTPYGDLYEVATRTPEGPLIYYVDSGATVIILGNVIDVRTGQDLTRNR